MKQSLERLNRTQQQFARTMKRFVLTLFFFVVLLGAMYGFVQFYPYIFSRNVHGVIMSVDRVQLNVSLMQGGQAGDDKINPQLFSFAIAIREDNGEIITASAEDRQWAAAQRGLCAEAVFYPYPPWKVMKSGTYFNARLDRLYECPDKAANLQPVPPPAPAVGAPSTVPGGGAPAGAPVGTPPGQQPSH